MPEAETTAAASQSPTLPKKAWTVEHPGRNVHVVRWDLGPSEEAWILLRADAHHDNPHSDHEMQRRHLERVVERGGAWIDGGDLFCLMGGKYDPRSSKVGKVRPENMRNDYVDACIASATDFYCPYARHCIALGKGNHETSIEKRLETSPTDRLAQMLTARSGVHVQAGGYGGFVHFIFGYGGARQPLTMHYFHGSGGGGIMSSDTLRTRRIGSYVDADVYFSGHTHDQWWMKLPRSRLKTAKGLYEVVSDPVYHVRPGTYKDEYGDGAEGWHIETGKPPKAIGAVWMRVAVGKRHALDGGRRQLGLHIRFEEAD
jgi:hypothetical protein